MKFIPPLEIASKIMTLIEDTNKYLVVVSPYVNFRNWEKMKLRLKRALDRGVKIDFYIRQNADVDMEQFNELGISPIRIQDLHAKLYYNEAYAIVTSQNMIKYSDENSIDLGYVTETEEELKQLINFTDRNLKTHSVTDTLSVEQPVQNLAIKMEETVTKAVAPPAFIDTVYRVLASRHSVNKLSRYSNYIFSNKLFGSGDLMAGKAFTVQLHKVNPEWEKYEESLKNVDRTGLKNRFVIQLSDNKRYSYVSYVPASIDNATELAQDYLLLIDKLQPFLLQPASTSIFDIFDWKKHLSDTLSSRLNGSINVYHNYDKVEVKTSSNNYTACIESGKTNNLRIAGILSRKELEFAKRNNNKLTQSPDMKIELVEGKYGYYDTAWGTSVVNLQSNSFSKYLSTESKQFADLIIAFVTRIEELKRLCNQ